MSYCRKLIISHPQKGSGTLFKNFELPSLLIMIKHKKSHVLVSCHLSYGGPAGAGRYHAAKITLKHVTAAGLSMSVARITRYKIYNFFFCNYDNCCRVLGTVSEKCANELHLQKPSTVSNAHIFLCWTHFRPWGFLSAFGSLSLYFRHHRRGSL